MNSPVRMRLAGLIMVGLVACSPQPDPPQATTAAVPAGDVVARGRVDVEGGPLPLTMAADGVIDTVAVVEGQHVTRGQLLIATDPTPATLDLSLARAHLQQARAQESLLASRAAAARVHAARLVAAAREDAGDRQSADDARQAAVEAEGELENARAGARVAQADVGRANYQIGQRALHAPVDGDVQRLQAWPGMRVSAQGAPLLTLLPSSARIVRAELSQDVIARIVPGAGADILSDDGRQTPLSRARVLRVGQAYGQSTLQEDPIQRLDERTVQCVLALDGATAPLRVGQRVLVRFDAPGRRAEPAERLAKPRSGTL